MLDHLNWTDSQDRRDLVHRAVEHLAKARLVVFPTETEYVIAAHADRPEAVETLWQQRPPSADCVDLAWVTNEESVDLLPATPVSARRLARRCWPGPLDLLVPVADSEEKLLKEQSIAATVATRATQLGTVRVVCSGHSAIMSTLELLRAPVVLAPATPEGTAPIVDAEAARDQFGEFADAIVDDGKTRFAQRSTIVRVTQDDIALAREGVVSAPWVRRLAGEMITFVCTGNTCRSPMAEALFKRFLADELDCSIDELPERGYTISSAGIAAHPGTPAAKNAVEVVRGYNAQLDDHMSQPLSDELAVNSDRLIVMTQEHKALVCRLWPEVESRTSLLCGDQDVSDPIGGAYDRYEGCAVQIAEHLRLLLADVTSRR